VVDVAGVTEVGATVMVVEAAVVEMVAVVDAAVVVAGGLIPVNTATL